MQKNLVIVESPAKAKTIEKFLGDDFKVMSSYGHIRDLKKRELSIDDKTLEPEYEIPEEKTKLVADLNAKAKKAEKVWLASDEDREGEAISWHLCEVLGLDKQKTNRIVFHEITKPAILEAIEHPRHINMDLVNAQQARRVLDRLVGFKLSPVLWRKVKPALSAGRVQSVAVRLIVEREREIQNFQSEVYYNVNGVFAITNVDGSASEVKAQLASRFKTEQEVLTFLEKCKEATFTVEGISKKPVKRTPAPPFTTSTLQQEAARKLGFSVSQTMMVAQHLYENGRITYMRTDSVNLSKLCLGASKNEIVSLYGDKYSKTRQYHTSAKGAQEAHEAIRPTYMDQAEIEGTAQEKRLYELIWKRTIASQMADAQIEKTTANIRISGTDEYFVAQGEVVKFDGFIKVYRESLDDDDQQDEFGHILPPMKEGQQLTRREVLATERFTMGPQRYTEASLVHKMEELGIGRPSTYAPTISTIQQREYVQRGDKKGEERPYSLYQLKGKQVTQKTRKEMVGSEKGKLLPTDIGIVVNDFLMEHFKEIMDYNFTAKVEQDFDKIAEGDEKWTDMMKQFYKSFEPTVEKTMNSRQQHKAGERQLGKDPKTGKPVFVKIGRFGPVVQIGTADDKEKPQFAQLPKEQSMETITLEEALELFKLPREVGEYENKPVTIGAGRFGPYVLHDRQYTSLPKGTDPMTITLDEAIALIQEKRQQDSKKHMKFFLEDSKLEILNGRYGPYLVYDGKNYRLPKNLHEKATELTYDQCMKIIQATPVKKG
ncbi:DNA topoisomerase-1 [Xylanibacter ruminicola]|jgi:DNA topoisomerase-1|uniref:DNA topoisomerase 1 n=1 Tax=Xylanibacter ruminicola TaxID=839 RepID=A0A1H5T9Y7_XYLRU|nr:MULTISPECIES: type I DNA topoisomerase [Prevotellaceae]MCR5469468.1 type I DNA topoisomerase [Prevotella sp.]SEF59692.1 DNA topoisomerase-1 [Xylanibacter ruminicola]